MFTSRCIGIYTRSVRSYGFKSIRFNSTGASPKSDWTEYFRLKKLNNRLNVTSSVFTALGGSLATLTAIGNVEIDLEKPIMGFDPIMVFAGVVILGGGFGYILGPFIGSALFNLKYKANLRQFKLRDELFLQKIKKHRVDPSSQSFSNPVPDYYGERIYSLKDYRQWLRDCNAYRRKTKEFL